MNTDQTLQLIEVPKNEEDEFKKLIRNYRKKYIRSARILVQEVFDENPAFLNNLTKEKQVSPIIREGREMVWQKFLINEAEFNTQVLKDLNYKLQTPSHILDTLVQDNVVGKEGEELVENVKRLCGEYAGRIYPYIYMLSLSNTQSRRVRAGATFEAIVYQIYDYLNYPFDSQKKAGKKVFDNAGLGKKVDSILPSVACFNQRRDKTIIGTMKTSLRERWQEVAEEISRTNIPAIHLLTVDESISVSKARQMGEHNIIVVTFDDVASSEKFAEMRKIISFETYMFTEVPAILDYWTEN